MTFSEIQLHHTLAKSSSSCSVHRIVRQTVPQHDGAKRPANGQKPQWHPHRLTQHGPNRFDELLPQSGSQCGRDIGAHFWSWVHRLATAEDVDENRHCRRCSLPKNPCWSETFLEEDDDDQDVVIGIWNERLGQFWLWLQDLLVDSYCYAKMFYLPQPQMMENKRPSFLEVRR